MGPHGPCPGALGHSAVSVGGEAADGAVPQVRCRKVMVLRAGSWKGAALELGVFPPALLGPACEPARCWGVSLVTCYKQGVGVSRRGPVWTWCFRRS